MRHHQKTILEKQTQQEFILKTIYDYMMEDAIEIELDPEFEKRLNDDVDS